MTDSSTGAPSAQAHAQRWLDRLRSSTAFWHAAVVLGAGLFALIWYMREELIKLNSLQGSGWDLGFDQQVVWNIANGHGFYSSFSHHDFLTDHFELILVLPAVVERFWADPRVLLFIGDLGLAATAPAAYLMLRAVLGPGAKAGWLAAALAAPIPFWAATQQAARDDFHPENIALSLALVAAWAGLRGRTRLMWVAAVLALACKEDQVYAVGVAGLLIAARAAPELRRHGRYVVAAAAAWLVVMIGVVQNILRLALEPSFTSSVLNNSTATSQDDYYYWLLHPSVGEFLHTIANGQAWQAVGLLIASLCGLPLLRPKWLLLALPPFAANLLSHHEPQAAMVLHYSLLPIFPVIVAAALGGRRLLEWSEAWRMPAGTAQAGIAAAAIPALVIGFLAGSIPPGRAADLGPYSFPDARADLDRAMAFIPASAAVSADDGLTPWLADRTDVHGFPGQDDSGAYVVLDKQARESGASWIAAHNRAVAALAVSGRRLLFDDARLQVWSPVGG